MNTGPASSRRPPRRGPPSRSRSALVRVGLLAACQLDDDRTDVRSDGGLEHGARHVERLGAEVDGGHGEPGTSPRPRAAYRSWMLADRAPSPGWPPRPATGGGRGGLVGREGRGPREVTDAVAAEASLIVDDQAVAVEVRHRLDGLEEVGGEVATWGTVESPGSRCSAPMVSDPFDDHLCRTARSWLAHSSGRDASRVEFLGDPLRPCLDRRPVTEVAGRARPGRTA